MSRMLHLVALDEVVAANFPQAIERFIVTCVVTAANQENIAIVRVLHALEIVREACGAWIVDLLRRRHARRFRVKIHSQNGSRIF